MMSCSPFDPAPALWSGGPGPSGHHDFPNRPPTHHLQPTAAANKTTLAPKARSQYPITTGASVFGLKFKDGVVLAADTLGSYGSLARFPELERVVRVNDSCVVACTGDYADFQFVREVLEQKQRDCELFGGMADMEPAAVHCWLTRLLYNRRSRFNPLWISVMVAGVQDGKPFLGLVDHLGTVFKEDYVSTGLGAHIAVPIMRAALDKKDDLTEEEAKEVIKECLRVCFLRDCRASKRYHLAVVGKDGKAKVEKPEEIDTNWQIAKEIKGYE